MKEKNNKEIDRLVDCAAGVSGTSRENVEKAFGSNPLLTSALSKMSQEDVSKLIGILNDPEKSKKIMATPQAQQLLNSLGKSGKK